MISVWLLVVLLVLMLTCWILGHLLDSPALMFSGLGALFAALFHVGVSCDLWWCSAGTDERRELLEMLGECPDTKQVVHDYLDNDQNFLTTSDVNHYQDMCTDERLENINSDAP